MNISAKNLDSRELNEKIKDISDEIIIINDCMGQRYIGSGVENKMIEVNGVAGNALGAYLKNNTIIINGNAQDGVGDTMDGGEIYIYGSAGDATGYAMRGGKIFIEKSTGYRAGIHMKEYKDYKPVIVIGEKAGDFLGEYQAGGLIIVLGIDCDGDIPVGNFCGVGMHGGKIFLRCNDMPKSLPDQVSVSLVNKDDMKEIDEYIEEFCNKFHKEKNDIVSSKFYILTPNTRNPYKQMYTHN